MGARPLGRACVAGTVARSVFLGAAVQVEVRLESGEVVIAQVAPTESFSEGEAVQIWWDANDELRFGRE